MYLIYRKNNNKVISISKKPQLIIGGNLEQLEYNFTSAEKKMLKDNFYDIIISGDSVKFKLNKNGVENEERIEKQYKKNELKQILKDIKKNGLSDERVINLLTELIK